MMTRPGRYLLVLLLCLPAPLGTGFAAENDTEAEAEAEAEEEALQASVTYLAGASIYVDAGRDDGLRMGDRLEVVRDNAVVAVLEVVYLSANRVSCKIVEGDAAIQVGDTVRFDPSGGPVPALSGPASSALADPAMVTDPVEGSRSKRRGGIGIHGRVGVRYLALANRADATGDYSQPGINLRLDGHQIAGSGWNLAVDVRARRITRTLSDGSDENEDRTRVYRAAVGWQGRTSPWRFTAGRQFIPNAAVVSIFDGISGDYTGRRWAAGVFTGSQPDLTDYSYSDTIKEHGGWVQFRGKAESPHRWAVTTGLIGSYDQSEVNREFLYLQERYTGGRFSFYGLQEIDFNRDWKADEGENTVSLTSIFTTFRYQARKNIWLRAGYDNRRNVRLYRDRVTPVTEFDDRFRRGAWVGTTFRVKQRYRLGFDLRNRGGQDDVEDTNTYSLFFSAQPFTRQNLGFRVRSSRYTGENSEGWLHSLGFGFEPARRLRLELQGGLRDETLLRAIPVEGTLVWYGLDLEVALGRHWYLYLSGERTDGEVEEYDQIYTTVSYRF